MKQIFSALFVITTFFYAPAALSTAMYSTTAHSTFALSGAGVSYSVGPVFPSKTEIGTGTAAFSGIQSTPPAVADLFVSISGSASPPSYSLATSTYMSSHLFTIDNLSGTTELTLPFTFFFEWDVKVSVDDPLHEFADAGAFFHITGIDDEPEEKLVIGGLTVAEYLFHPHFSTDLFETGGAGSMTVTGDIKVDAYSKIKFSVITDSSGTAAVVPEPSTLWLLGFGLAFVGLRQFRRHEA